MINEELKKYVEEHIFKEYSKNESGHGINHIKYVIERGLRFAKEVSDINIDMVYVICAYHDICHHIDAKNHEKVSSEILLADKELKKYFNDEQIKIMSEAIYDHRASLEYEPRSIYGKIVSSADRNTYIEDPFKRTYTYRISHSPEATLEEIVDESMNHLINKFGRNGYASNKMYFKDDDYDKFLSDLEKYTSDKEIFREKYYEINNIYNTKENMLFLYNEIKNSHEEFDLDKIIKCVYIKLLTDKTYDEIKEELISNI